MGTSLAFAPPLWVFASLPAAVFLIVRQARRQPAGILYIQSMNDALYASWLRPSGEPGEQAMLRCHYLGPWLLGLELGHTRFWLWPDSLPGRSHRALRRRLHRPGQQRR